MCILFLLIDREVMRRVSPEMFRSYTSSLSEPQSQEAKALYYATSARVGSCHCGDSRGKSTFNLPIEGSVISLPLSFMVLVRH